MFLQLDNISFSYPGTGIPVFSDLSLTFMTGWTVIAGANGTGKSTLISIAAGLLEPDSGSVKREGDVILCSQVFDGLSPADWSDIFSGDNHVGMLKSMLAITDEMIEREESLSGGEKKRLQLLAALSHSPEILILDEPTNHLDAYSRDLIIKALRSFDGIGIIVSHDRTFASSLSERTLLLERGTDEAATVEDIPLTLAAALEESRRRKQEKRNTYSSILSSISDENMIARSIRERSLEKQKNLSKRGIDRKDHDAKARIDGARLTSKDASLDGAMRNHISRSVQLEEKLAGMKKPLLRKEGLSLTGGNYVPSISFPESVLHSGDYSLIVPSFSIKPGSHIALTGRNGSGKTLFLKNFHEYLSEHGKGQYVLYIPQEFSEEELCSLSDAFMSLEDDEKGLVLSDMYRMGSNPSALFTEELSKLSPGELKKLAIALSRRNECTVLLMDEPTNHLDIVSMGILEKMFREDGKDLTMIIVSHDESFLAACTDISWVVERDGNEGKIRFL